MQTCSCAKNMDNYLEMKPRVSTHALCLYMSTNQHYQIRANCTWFIYSLCPSVVWLQLPTFICCVIRHVLVVYLFLFFCSLSFALPPTTFRIRSLYDSFFWNAFSITMNIYIIVVQQTTLNAINSIKYRHWHRSSMCIFALNLNSPCRHRRRRWRQQQ